MKSPDELRVSVVVPAHNEEQHIADCIDSLLSQSVLPDEIIIVDNASTDKTAEIVKAYASKLVRLIHEAKPGVRHARSAGFNAAKNEIIARTDADCKVDEHWVERIKTNFTDKEVVAISGPFYYFDMPAQEATKIVEGFIRGELNRLSKHSQFLAGANMAIRREVWQKIRPKLCDDGTIHEDLDIAIHLTKAHQLIRFDPKLTVGTSARRIYSGLKPFYDYMRAYEHTYNAHDIYSVTLKIPIVLYFPFYPVVKVIRRFYDPETNKLSIKQLLKTSEQPIPQAKDVVESKRD